MVLDKENTHRMILPEALLLFDYNTRAIWKVIRLEGVICPEGGADLDLVKIVSLLSDDGVLRTGVRRAACCACH